MNIKAGIEYKAPKKNKIPVSAVTIIFFMLALIGWVGFYLTREEPKEEEWKKEVVVEEVVEQVPSYCVGEIQEYICSKDWDDKIAIAIAYAESNMNPEAINWDTRDVGIFQVHYQVHNVSVKDMLDWQKNVDKAYEIWQKSGWNAWVAFKTGVWYVVYREL